MSLEERFKRALVRAGTLAFSGTGHRFVALRYADPERARYRANPDLALGLLRLAEAARVPPRGGPRRPLGQTARRRAPPGRPR